MAAEFAYDLNYHYGNAAPQRIPQEIPRRAPQPKPQLHRVPRQKKAARIAQRRKEQERQANRTAAKLFAFMALAIILFGVFCNSFVARTTSREMLDEANRRLEQQKEIGAVLEDYRSDLVTAENIDKVAAALGLVKVQEGSASYLNLSGENRVRTCQKKAFAAETQE